MSHSPSSEILGSNFEEGRLFLLGAAPVTNDAEYLDALGRLFGNTATAVATTYPTKSFPTPEDALVRVWGDYRLGCPTYESAQRFARNGGSTRMYAFSRTIPGLEALGPTHGTELPYVFGTLPTMTADDTTLTHTIEGYWTRFAATGDPNGGSALTWPAFTDTSDVRMGLDVPASVLTNYRKVECTFWETVYDAEFH